MQTLLAKLSSSPEADQALDRMLKATNESFKAGRLTKTDLLSWVLCHFEGHAFPSSIDKIHEAHFDPVAYLKNVVKEMEAAKRSGVESQDLGLLLAPLTGIKGSQRLKQKALHAEPKLVETTKKHVDNR